MFSEWVVDALRLLAPRLNPTRARFLYPARFLADVLFAIFVFLCLNRRILYYSRAAFWGQLLYLMQLFKVAFTLRFLLSELVFRELRTFFCFIHPMIARLSIMKQWRRADPCVLKVVNMAFFLAFVGLNLLMAYGIEKLIRCAWRSVSRTKKGRRLVLYLGKPLLIDTGPTRKRHRRRGRRRRRRRRQPSRFRDDECCNFICPGSSFPSDFWHAFRKKKNVSPKPVQRKSEVKPENAPKPSPGETVLRKTRSGRTY